MKTAIRIFLLFTLTTMISSCAFHSGVMTGNAALSDANFFTVGYAMGTSEITKVLGMGGVATDALVLEAKRNLYKNHPLTKGQALANVSVDFKRTIFPFVSKLKVLISADIIDFNDGAKTVVNLEDFPLGVDSLKESETKMNDEIVYFILDDKVMIGKVLDYKGMKAKVLTYSHLGHLKVKKIVLTKLFFQNETTKPYRINYKVGQEISYKDYVVDKQGAGSEVKRFGTIVGMGHSAVVVEYSVEGEMKRAIVWYESINPKE